MKPSTSTPSDFIESCFSQTKRVILLAFSNDSMKLQYESKGRYYELTSVVTFSFLFFFLCTENFY